MSTLRKELVREIMADGGFTKANDIGVYLRDMFKKKKIDYPLSGQSILHHHIF